MTTYITFAIGVIFGIYIGNSTVRQKVHAMIDKYIFKRNTKTTYKSTEPATKSEEFLIVNGVKYTKDVQNGGNT